MTKLQKKILEDYNDLLWEKKPLKNDCENNKFVLNNTQKFIKKFFVPELNQKGMILVHSVGAGKTCSAILAAQNFETDYNILWVTQYQLKGAMWKNILGNMSCHSKVKTQKIKTKRKFNIATKNKWIGAYSYKSFTNALIDSTFVVNDGSVEEDLDTTLRKKLIELNGNQDLLKKTLIIFDEAHNLVNDKLSEMQKPNFSLIKSMIQNSYNKSKNDSCKVLLLSATPLLDGISGYNKLLNLMIPLKKDKLPEKNKDIENLFKLNHDLTFFGKKLYRNTAKFTSFLNLKSNKNLFPQVKKIKLYNMLQKADFKKIETEINRIKSSNECKISYIVKLIKELEDFPLEQNLQIEIFSSIFDFIDDISILENLFKKHQRLSGCKSVKNKRECKRTIKVEIKELKKSVPFKNNLKKCNINKRNKLKELKKDLKSESKIQSELLKSCANKRGYDKKIECIIKNTLYNTNNIKSKNQIDRTDYNQLASLINDKNNALKIHQLIDRITRMDKYSGYKYKHVIFANRKNIKMVVSMLSVLGFDPMIESRNVQNNQGQMVPKIFLKNNIETTSLRNKKFGILTSTSFWNTTIKKRDIYRQINNFNNRTNNSNGQKFRFMVFDQDFLEGVDMLDVKYMHILDPFFVPNQEEQLIGRVIRTCSHKMIKFNKGWKVNVYLYKTYLENKRRSKDNYEDKTVEAIIDIGIGRDNYLNEKTITKAIKKYALDKELVLKKY